MDLFIFTQVFMSVIFFVFAIAKLTKLSSFMDTLRQLRIKPVWARIVVVIVPLVELVACLLLLLTSTLLYGEVLVLVLLGSYVWAAWRAKGRMVNCNWFGGLISEKFGFAMYVRIVVLLTMCIFLLVAPAQLTVDSASILEIITSIFSSLGIIAIYLLVLTLRQYNALYQD